MQSPVSNVLVSTSRPLRKPSRKKCPSRHSLQIPMPSSSCNRRRGPRLQQLRVHRHRMPLLSPVSSLVSLLPLLLSPVPGITFRGHVFAAGKCHGSAGATGEGARPRSTCYRSIRTCAHELGCGPRLRLSRVRPTRGQHVSTLLHQIIHPPCGVAGSVAV